MLVPTLKREGEGEAESTSNRTSLKTGGEGGGDKVGREVNRKHDKSNPHSHHITTASKSSTSITCSFNDPFKNKVSNTIPDIDSKVMIKKLKRTTPTGRPR
ncbi:hypothetical protein GOP47_0026791 [Adiantum capillus-veneris]|nr:hypothetical protein GOP47_0026791 [Adiantum capillus-veneris]